MTKIHYYKGYAIDKPEGCTIWNIHEADAEGRIDWCFSVGHVYNLKEGRNTIDAIIEEKEKEILK